MRTIKRSPKYTKQEVIEALEASNGLVSLAADRLNITPEAIYKRMKTDPDIAEVMQTARNRQLDFAESQLFKAIANGELTAMIFYLKTIGKQRGYVERQEMGGALNITIEHVQQPLPED